VTQGIQETEYRRQEDKGKVKVQKVKLELKIQNEHAATERASLLPRKAGKMKK
jgi:hypothetical protein